MSGGLNLLAILGGIGGGLQQAPQAMAQAQQLKMQAQKMEDDRISSATGRISTLASLATQIPTMATSPGFQSAMMKSFKDLGVDPNTLPKDQNGNIDLSGLGSQQLGKLMQDPARYKTVVSTPQGSARQALYESWGEKGQAPDYFTQGIPYQPTLPAGFNEALGSIVKGVQSGGDPVSAVGQLKTMYDTGQFSQNPEALNDAVTTVLQASASPQARLAISTNQEKFNKLVADTSNAIKTGKMDDATIQKTLASIGLIKAQTAVQKGIPDVQASEIARNYAGAKSASAAAEHSAAETENTNLHNYQLMNQISYNQQHGIPVNPSEIKAMQDVSASLSNQVKQWGDVKTKTLDDMTKFKAAIAQNVDGKHPDGQLNADDQKVMNVLMSRYQNANTQMATALQRQQHASALVALPNGMRPFTAGKQNADSAQAGSNSYTKGQKYSVTDAKTHRAVDLIYVGGPPNEPSSWAKP